MMRRDRYLALLFGFIIAIPGCIAVPIPTPEHKVLAGTPVTEEQLSFIHLKKTSQTDVLVRLGSPYLIWEEARIFVYEWEMRQGVLIWAIGAGTAGGVGASDIPKRYVLLIEFDSEDRVERFEVVDRPPFKSYGEFLRGWAADPHD